VSSKNLAVRNKKNINYFDLGAHLGTEIILFLWHINFLRNNDYLKNCSVNIYGFEPSPIIELLKRRLKTIRYLYKGYPYPKKVESFNGVYSFKNSKKAAFNYLEHGPAPFLNIFNEQFNKEKTSLLDGDIENINIYEKALTSLEGKFKLFLSERIEEYTTPELGYGDLFNVEDIQPMDYLGSTLFKSKVTGGIDKNIYKEVDGILLSRWIKENIDNFKNSINILKLNIEGSESMVISDLIESDMLKYFQIICGHDLLADVKKIPQLVESNKEFEKLIKDNDIQSRFVYFCASGEAHFLKDFGMMSERIEDELIKRDWT